MSITPGRALRALGLTLVLGALALALVACGGGSEGADVARADEGQVAATTDATSTDPSDLDPEEAQLAFARCMREQGLDWPDPEPDQDGGLIRIAPGAGVDPESAKVQDALEQCRHFLDAARPELTEEQRQEFRDNALKFARCMREHGVDIPDPTFGADGRPTGAFRLRIDPNDPNFREAEEACRGELGDDAPVPGRRVTRSRP